MTDGSMPDGADDLLEDLVADADAAEDVTGGSTASVARASGFSRARETGHARVQGSGMARHASGGVLAKLAAEQGRAAQGPARIQIITDTAWLAEKGGAWKRASEGVEGKPLTLEALVRTQHAPDGTDAVFEVFKHDRDGTETPIARLEGKVQGGKAQVQWTYEQKAGAVPAITEAIFRVAVKDDRARSSALPFESFLDVAVANEDGSPRPCTLVVKLPGGRERRVQTDAQGKATLRTVIGLAEIRAVDDKSGAGLEFTVADRA